MGMCLPRSWWEQTHRAALQVPELSADLWAELISQDDYLMKMGMCSSWTQCTKWQLMWPLVLVGCINVPGFKVQWSVNHPCSGFAWDAPNPRLWEEPTGGTKGKSSSWIHQRKRNLKLFEKRRCHPSLTSQRMQPGQAHTKALGPTPGRRQHLKSAG